MITARVLAAEDRAERAVQLLEEATNGQDTEGKRILLLGAIHIQPSHLLNPDVAVQFLLQSRQESPDDAAVDEALISLFSQSGDSARLAEYLCTRTTPFDRDRFRRGASLFTSAGLHERAAAVLEMLYDETDAIDDLFLLAEAFRRTGKHEVLISMLEERRNEDPRIDTLLKQELAVYSELLKRRSMNSDDSFATDGVITVDPNRSTPDSSGLLLPLSTDAPLPELSTDEESLDEKISSAFHRLRIKPNE